MKRPLSAVVPIHTSVINVHKTEHFNLDSNNPQNHHNSTNDPMQVKSTLSNSKRQKVPDSMKTFLKQRKFVRQIQENSQKNPQNRIQLNKNLLNSSQLGLNNSKIANDYSLDQFGLQNELPIVSNKKKMIQRPVSRQIYPNLAICPICEGQLTEKNQVKVFSCRHIYCQQCAKSYVKFKINMFQQVPCPQQSCSAVIKTDTDFYKNLTKRERRIYSKIKNFYIAQSDPSKKLCPKQDCEGIITISESSLSQECSSCKGKFCSSCFLEVHSGKCRDYEIKFMEDTLHYRQCAKCRVVVERVEGCNHMTCRCGYQFCYMCGAKWNHEHLCNPDYLQDNGCDWGQNWQDHFVFLVKLPLKFVLTTIYSLFWFGVSFAAAPYNMFFFMYWIVLIFFGGVGQYIFQREDRPCWEILLLLLISPLLVIYCIPIGIRLFLRTFQEQCPFISEGYRFIIRI